jgi:hypothetical protein
MRQIDTSDIPWKPEPDIPGMLYKPLRTDPDTGGEVLARFIPPGWGIAALGEKPMRHYHRTVSERSLQVHGDFPHWEYRDAHHVPGECVVKRKGWFMDRPPRCIHGIEDGPVSQVGAISFYWSSGGGTGVESGGRENVEVKFSGDLDAYGDDFTQVRYVDTLRLSWQSHPNIAGWKWKLLTEPDVQDPVALHLVPPGWRPDSGAIYGPGADMARWLYVVQGEGDAWVRGEKDLHKIRVKEGTFLELGAGETLGWEGSMESATGYVILCAMAGVLPNATNGP